MLQNSLANAISHAMAVEHSRARAAALWDEVEELSATLHKKKNPPMISCSVPKRSPYYERGHYDDFCTYFPEDEQCRVYDSLKNFGQ